MSNGMTTTATVEADAENAYDGDTLVGFDDVLGRGEVLDSADVVVVGSGAAGATCARVLAEAGVSVILVEEGPLVRTRDMRADVYSTMKSMWRQMGSQLARGRAFIPLLQGRCVGGSTVINSAIVHRLPERIHALWAREYGLGEALSYERLSRIWDQIEKELHIAPTDARIQGENNRLLQVGASALGFESHPTRRNVHRCRGSARCAQGCPHGAKQSMNLSYVPRALRHGARIYATAKVERVLAEGGRATGIEARFVDPSTGRKGPVLTVRARHAVVLAASALQTPLILAKSGIGRQSKLVGRRLQLHPATAVVGIFDRPIKLWFGATQGFETSQFLEDDMKIETVALPPELAAVRLPALGPELVEQLASYGHLAQWGVEVRAKSHGTVKPGLFGFGPRYSWDAADDDVRIAKRGVAIICEMMFAAGAQTVLPGVFGIPDAVRSMDEIRKIDDLPDDPSRFHFIAAHHFGTAVMGPDPATSVVGPNGESHELPGLYVADGSIFPTTIGVNPQHTICGLAWHVAERIAESIPKRERRARKSIEERRITGLPVSPRR